MLNLMHRFTRQFHTFPVPSDTPRYTLKDGSLLILKAREPATTTATLPPLLRPRIDFPKLDKDTREKIISLRNTTPMLWTVRRLAKKFQTHESNIMSLVQCPKERWDELQAEIDQEFNALTPHKKRVIIDRMRRKALW